MDGEEILNALRAALDNEGKGREMSDRIGPFVFRIGLGWLIRGMLLL